MCKRKICVVTGSRAEYGLLYWLMREIAGDPDLRLLVAVTGMHLSAEFGLTARDIEADGFSIDTRVEMLLSSDTPVGIAKSMGLGVVGFADAFAGLGPDLVVLLGDRFELLSAAQAALTARIPIAHIHGGESSQGAVDEAIRHALTKMSHLHFVAAEPYRKRVIQLGEDPARVFNTGAPGLDHLRRMEFLTREELERDLGMTFREINLLVTYHPVTLGQEDPREVMTALMAALEHFPQATITFTRPNADTFGRVISPLIETYASRNPGRVGFHTSLGQRRYLSMLRQVDAVIGNSSSGIHEVPSFGKPTVNIGIRQAGRLKADSVIDCEANARDILAALSKALSPEFRERASKARSPYGEGNASAEIKAILKAVDLEGIVVKTFHDLDFDYEPSAHQRPAKRKG